MNRQGGFDFNQVMPMTPMCKRIIIFSTVFWFVAIVLAEQFFLSQPFITQWFSLTPELLVRKWAVWQLVTYLFVHTLSPFHIIFNLLLLWWLGSELERLWGSRYFLLYFAACGIGAGLLYTLVALISVLAGASPEILMTPVMGLSAATFGLMTAYGVVFGDRTVYFLFVFAMKARFFVFILGALELVLVLNNGVGQGRAASLAHLGGIVIGLLFLKLTPLMSGMRQGSRKKSKSTKLRLVVNNPNEDEDKPKYWN